MPDGLPSKTGKNWFDPTNWIDTKDVRNRTASSIVVALIMVPITGIAALVWNAASQGGLVRALGGVTLVELEGAVKKLALPGPQGAPGAKGDIGPRGEPGPPINVPAGAVVAFDIREGCPRGWAAFETAQGRSIIGATPGVDYDDKRTGTNYSDYPIKPHVSKPSEEKAQGRLYSFSPDILSGQTYSFEAVFTGYLALNYCKKSPE